MKCTIYCHEKEYSPNYKALKHLPWGIGGSSLMDLTAIYFPDIWSEFSLTCCLLAPRLLLPSGICIQPPLGVFLSSPHLIIGNGAFGTLLPGSWQLLLSIRATSWFAFQSAHALHCVALKHLPKGRGVHKASALSGTQLNAALCASSIMFK